MSPAPNSLNQTLDHFRRFLIESGSGKRKISRVTVKNYVSDVNRFFSWLSSQPDFVSQNPLQNNLSTSKISLYLNHLKEDYSPSTISRHTASLNRFSTFLDLKYSIKLSPITSDSSPLLVNQPASTQQLLSQFKKHLKDKKRSHSTVKNYLSDVNHFLTWAANSLSQNPTSLPDILTLTHLKAYQNHLKLTQKSSSVISRRTSAIKTFSRFAYQHHLLPKNPFARSVNIPKIAPLAWFKTKPQTPSTPSKNPLIRKITTHPIYTKYNSLSFTPYLHLALLLLFVTTLGIFGYHQIVKQASPSSAYPTSLTAPTRQLSFQGRLTDSSDNPITTAVNVTFKLYDDATAGSELYSSGACSITPDQDGIFNTIIGDTTCGDEIDASVFSENTEVWLEVTIGAETLDPRQQIATVAYAINTQTLQGYPASATATINTIPVINNDGDMIIAATSPTIESTSGTFGLKGEAVTISTATSSDGDITLSPDGTGQLLALGGTTDTDFLRITNANLTSGTLISGYVGNDTATGNLLTLSSGSSETDRVTIKAGGQTTIGAQGKGDSALIVNNLDSSDLFSASASGTPRFTVENDGDLLFHQNSNIYSQNTLSGLDTTLTLRGSTITLQGNAAQELLDLTPSEIVFNDPGNDTDFRVESDDQEYMLFVNAGDDRIGIANNSPGYTLDTTGTINASSQYRINSQNLAVFSSNTLLLGSDNASHLLGFSAGGTQVAVFDTSGQLGINTDTPEEILTANGNIQLGVADGTRYIYFDNGTGNNAGLRYNSSTTKMQYSHDGSTWEDIGSGSSGGYWTLANGSLYPINATLDLFVGGTATTSAKFAVLNVNDGTPTASISGSTANVSTYLTGEGSLATTNMAPLTLGGSTTGPIQLSPKNTTGLYIDGSGQVGIGTTDPDQLLEVSSSTPVIRITSTEDKTWSVGDVVGSLEFYSEDASGNFPAVGAAIKSIVTDDTYGSKQGLAFYTNADGTNPTQRLVITGSDGYLGIGTDSPEEKITVTGNIQLGVSDDTRYIYFDNGTGNNAGLRYNSSTTKMQYSHDGSSWSDIGSGTGASYWDIASGALAPVNATVDLLIGGTASDSAKFAVLNVNDGTPTASISGSTANVASYLTGEGSLATTNMAPLTLGGSTTGPIQLSPKGTDGLYVDAEGDVGIGTTSVDTNANLHLYDTAPLLAATSTNNESGLRLDILGLDEDTDKLFRLLDDNTTRFTVLRNGYTGIGTDTPSSELHLSGTAPILSITSTNNDSGARLNIIGLDADTDYLFRIQDEGTTRLTMRRDGDLGLGVDDPSAELHISGSTIDQAEATDEVNLRLARYTSGGRAQITFEDESLSQIWRIGTTAGGGTTFKFYDQTQDVFELEQNGDVVFNPGGGQLELADTKTINIGGKTDLAYNSMADSGDAPDEAAIAADNDLYLGGDLEVDGTIYGAITGTITPGFTQGSVVFADGSGNLDEDNTNFFWDDTNDFLGLGTNSPSYALDVVSTDYPVSQFQRTTSVTNDTRGVSRFLHTTDQDMVDDFGISVDWAIEDSADTINTIASIRAIRAGADDTGDLQFQTASSGTLGTVMTLTSSGKIGIGTTDPTSLLHLATNTTTLTGKSVLIINQLEDEDIFTASASGDTKMTLTSEGVLKLYNATSTISNTAGDITINAASDLISLSGDNLSNVATISAANAILSSTLQVATTTGQLYSSFGTNTTDHSGSFLNGADVLVSGDLELDGALFLDGGNIYNSAGNSVIYLDDSDRVGIGNLTPIYTLDISGDLRVTDTGNPGLTLGDGTTGFFKIGSGTIYDNATTYLSFDPDSDGSEEMVLTNDGELGVGTTSPEGIAHLYEGSAGSVTAPTWANNLVLESNNASGMTILAPDDNGAQIYFGFPTDNDRAAIQTYGPSHATAADLMTFRVGGSSRMTIDGTNGNVGIGTTSPAYTLDVSDTINTTTKYRINSQNLAYFSSNTLLIGSGNAAHSLGFSAGGAQVAVFDTSGQLGIGTSTPTADLDINGTTTKFSNQHPIYRYSFGGSTDTDWKKIADITISTGTYAAASFKVTITDANSNYGSNVSMKEMVYRVSAWRSSSVQDDQDTGSVSGPEADYVRLVKTSTGVYELQARQTTNYKDIIIEVQCLSEDDSTITYADSLSNGSTSGTIYTAATTHTDYATNLYVAGDIDYVGTLTDVSDINLKENLVHLENSLDIISALQGYTFNMIGQDPTNREVGVIAQDVQTVLPEAVRTIDNQGHLGVSYPFLIPVLIEATKEQQTQIQSLASNLENSGINLRPDQINNLDVIPSPRNPNKYEIIDVNGTTLPERVSAFTSSIIANLQAGSIVAQEIVTDSLTIDGLNLHDYIAQVVADILPQQQLVSPLAEFDSLTTETATVSGTLYAQNIENEHINYLDEQVGQLSENLDTLSTDYATASSILADIQARYSSYDDLINSGDTSSDPLDTSSLDTDNATISGQISLENNGSYIFEDIMVDSTLIASSLSSNLEDTLYLQPLANAPINLLAGIMTLSPDGTVTINGDLWVTGSIMAQNLETLQSTIYNLTSQTATIAGQLSLGQPATSSSGFGQLLAVFDEQGQQVASINASGSAQFNSLTTQNLVIASASATDSAQLNSDTTSNASAGTATLLAGQTNLTITNSNITPNTLIYLTPLSDTQNQVLYVSSKSAQDFTVSINQPLDQDIDFNYWLIQTLPVNSSNSSD